MLWSKAKTTWRGSSARLVCRCNLVNDALRFVVTEGSIVISYIGQMISAAIVGFSYRSGIVG